MMSILQELDADIEDQLGGYLSDISLKLLQEPIDFLTSNLHSYIKVSTIIVRKITGLQFPIQIMEK